MKRRVKKRDNRENRYALENGSKIGIKSGTPVGWANDIDTSRNDVVDEERQLEP
jgi:hypothetical protein